MATFIAPQNLKAIIGRKREQRQLSLLDKFRVYAILRDEVPSIAASKINAIVTKPPYGHKPLTDGRGFGRYIQCKKTIQQLIESNDPEAVKLGQKHGFCK